jgi:alanine-glyoxylate transaminase/serine-glyoxylate transaminase/serine-pyruvate transaminase
MKNTTEIPPRILLGPGPSAVHPRVLRAMSVPLVGHLDPAFLAIMEETKDLLRAVFRTENELTFPISGTGSAGMEACLVNLLEPGDTAIVGVNGVFGTRMAEIVERCGARAVRVEAPWGKIIEPTAIDDALRQNPGVALVALVHAETSTGVWQPVEEIAQRTRQADALLVLDTVTSLGGCPVEIDRWLVDAAYSGTQKCLSCPPGLAPVTFGPRAIAKLRGRKSRVQSWYLDLTLIQQYWGEERVYHHTAPISMSYALREALRLVVEEGLEQRWSRHARHHAALAAGLAALGLEFAAQQDHRLWMLNSVRVPAGVDEAAVRRALLEELSIEIGGGLGPLKGRTWRIGLMGESSREENVLLLLSGFERILARFGQPTEPGAAVAAAGRALSQLAPS